MLVAEGYVVVSVFVAMPVAALCVFVGSLLQSMGRQKRPLERPKMDERTLFSHIKGIQG